MTTANDPEMVAELDRLNAAVADSRRVGLGSRVARIARGVDGFDLELTRDGTASAPIDLS